MAFTTITFSGNVTGSVVSGFANLMATGSFELSVSGSNSGAVTGTWSFSGFYDNNNPYYPNEGTAALSGSVTGTGGANGPWTLALGGRGEAQGLTLGYAGGQWSLTGQAGFFVQFTASSGYDYDVTFTDHYRLALGLSQPGSAPGSAVASDAADNLVGTSASESITALAGNDTIQGGGGNDSIDGGTGVDTAVFPDVRANYTIGHNGSTWTVTHSGSDGVDTLTNVERMQFSDTRIAIDVTGNGGQAYRLYKAAFDREPDVGGLGYQMNELDKGFSLSQVAAAFIASPEFQSKYGSAVDDTAFVTLLYRNVLDREPESAGLAFHLNDLAHGVTRAQLLTNFSESPENQANVIGLIQDGMVYTLA